MIKKISINNFKSIKNEEVEFPSFVAIVGKNSAGKTNLLQALGIMRNLVLGSDLDTEQSRISLVPSELFNFNEDSSEEFSLKILVSTKNNIDYELSFSAQIKTDLQKPSLIISKEKLVKKNYQTNSDQVIYIRNMNDFLQNGDTNFPLATDQNKLAIVLYKTEDTDNVKDVFKHILIPDFEDLYNLNSIGIGGIEKRNTTSVELADILVNLRHNRDSEYQEFLQIVKRFMPNFESLSELPATIPSDDTTKNQFMVVLDERYLTSSLSMRSISAGDIRTLYLIASSLNMDTHSCLIIEELENGIHPKRIVDLIDQLETIARVKKMQMIFTTHSPMVINSLSAAKVILTQKKEKSGSSFTLLENSEQITEIKDFLEHDGELTDYLFSK